jgi:hypothetical protein
MSANVSLRFSSREGSLTLAMAMSVEKIIGAIQGILGGPKLVHAKPNNPIVSSGAAFKR